jgi:DNA helicase-2/ATP-dependent DNA helicase PcrA
VIQLPTNYRCPASIVQIANKLVAHNRFRTEDKLPLEVGKSTAKVPEAEHLRLLSFETDDEEASGVAADLLSRGKDAWASAAILGRTRAVLEKVNSACHQMNVPAVISQRRDQFVSPEFQLLHAVLGLSGHPLDKRSFTNVVSFFNRLFGSTFQSDLLIAEAEGTQQIFMQRLYDAVQLQPVVENGGRLIELALKVAKEPTLYKQYTEEIRKLLASLQLADAENVDFLEDNAAWKDLARQINQTLGSTATLDQFLQELSMRSKEPPIAPGTVLLMTVHGAKGKEFDYVYVIGLAEEVMPTYFSLKAGEQSAEMEEERRNCFVAVTRTKESLTLSWAKQYKGWAKVRSRFLAEMGLA